MVDAAPARRWDFDHRWLTLGVTTIGSFLSLLTAPGLWTQRITTKPPSDEEVNVAILALKGAMALETKQGGELVIA